MAEVAGLGREHTRATPCYLGAVGVAITHHDAVPLAVYVDDADTSVEDALHSAKRARKGDGGADALFDPSASCDAGANVRETVREGEREREALLLEENSASVCIADGAMQQSVVEERAIFADAEGQVPQHSVAIITEASGARYLPTRICTLLTLQLTSFRSRSAISCWVLLAPTARTRDKGRKMGRW